MIPQLLRHFGARSSRPSRPRRMCRFIVQALEDRALLSSLVFFSSSTYSVPETAGTATITVLQQVIGGSGGGGTVNYATGDGTAVAGTNYTPVSGTLTSGPNDQSQTFVVPVLQDDQPGPNRTVNLTLSSPTGSIILSTPSSAVLTIVDGDDGVVGRATPLGGVGTQTLAVNRALDTPTDIDQFSFNAAAGQVVRFDVARASGAPDLDVFIRLTDATGRQLAFNDDGPTPGRTFSRDASLTYRFTESGTFFVGISSFPNFRYDPLTGAGAVAGGTGGYGLKIFLAPPEVDNNDQIREARLVGTPAPARSVAVRNFLISSPTDVDMFRFAGRAGQRITISVTGAEGSSLAAFVRLFDARGRQLARGINRGRTSVLTLVLPRAGQYFIGVSGRGNAVYSALSGNGDRPGSTGAFTLTLSQASGQQLDAAAVPTGARVAGLVYFDQSGDGRRQSGEIAVSRRTVLVDRNNNGVRDDGEPVALSNSRGQFVMTGLPAGRTVVFAVPARQFDIPIEKVTGPRQGFFTLQLRARSRVANLPFGLGRYLA
jgi:hypothetical protein